MSEGRIMALDVGEVRTGVALSDPLQMIASPHCVVAKNSRRETIAELGRIIREEAPIRIVVGLPLNEAGEVGQQAEKTHVFVELLRGETEVEIVMQDERFTSRQADRTLDAAQVRGGKRRNLIDKIAAAHILQAHLDHLAAQSRERT